MPTFIREILAWSSPLVIPCLAGCEQENLNFGSEQGGASWTSNTTDAIPGIDEATVTSVTLNAGPPAGVRFVIWSDLPNGWTGSGYGRSAEAACEGHHFGKGHQLDYHAKTSDGKSGALAIGSTEYDLANGSLFLVAGRGDSPRVAQISYDLSGLPKINGDALKEFGRSSAPIRGFFETEKKEDTTADSGTR